MIILVLFIGHSGSGKNSIIKELIKLNSLYKYIVSSTSREIRYCDGESQGNPYIFINRDEFLNKIDSDLLIEYEEIHGNFYGLDIETIENCITDTESIYVKDIGVLGACKLKSLYGNKVHTIFIDVEDISLLKERLSLRGSSEFEITTRLNRINFERSFINEFDVLFTNKDLLKTSLDINNYLNNIYKI